MEFVITDELTLKLVEENGEKKVLVSVLDKGGESKTTLFSEEAGLLKKVLTNLYGLIK